MGVKERVQEVDRPFLWRTAIISILWLGLFTVVAILLLIFGDPIMDLFFG